MIKNFIIPMFFYSIAFAQVGKELTQEEKKSTVIDYSNIKNVLLSDGLTKEKTKKDKLVKQIKKERNVINVGRYSYPTENDFWPLVSELWLVKNAQVLRWDFPKPKYGIDYAFKQLLEKFGYFNKSFKVLIVNTPTITHFGLPAGDNDFIFIVSLPFMRSLDLTKVDISLLLFEDFLRLQKKYFITNLGMKLDFLGTNFHGKKIQTSAVEKTVEKYTKIVFETGFNFQQQYEVTKAMDQLLKSEPPLWGAYFKLYNKIDRFIKTDLLYKNYLKIYPSPELQLQWLSPKKKVI